MKKIAHSIFAVVLLMTATLTVSAQSEQNREVSGFSSLASAGPFDVHVKINGTESLKIKAGSEIINQIETVVDNGKLEIKFKHQFEGEHNDIGQIDVYVTAKSLSSLTNSGSGSIKVDGTVSGENVYLTLSGSGTIESAVKSGDMHATISGSGSIHINGSASQSKITISGSGDMDGKDFKTGSVSVMIAGSGSAYINAGKTVSAHIVGSGNVVYTGNASVENTMTVGSGRVSKAD
jgi:hypothetical protein